MEPMRKGTETQPDRKSSLTISVVIPSYKRHEEVVRAVRSALSQTLSPLEVIVSNDGSDPSKARALSELDDDRLRYVEAPRRGNASATRNYGIRHASGEWVALLDDDDVWRPGKLKAQLEALTSLGKKEAVLAGVEVVFAGGKRWYFRPSPPVPCHIQVDQVLFCGYGGTNTSTLMAPKWVFDRYPFDEGLERHEDWAWLLNAGKDLPFVVASGIVCERRLTPGEGVSRPGGFSFSRSWYEQHKGLMSSSGRGGFVANILSRKAAFDREITALPWLVKEIWSNSGISFVNLKQLIIPWLVPMRIRQAIKARTFGL